MRTETNDGKLISTDLHGVIDYAAGALSYVVPRVLGGTGAAIQVGNVGAAFAGTYAAMTRYERGVVPVLPMKTHLALDAAFGVGLLTAAALLKNEKPLVRAAFAGFGLFALWVSQNTEAASPMERAEHERFIPSKETVTV